MKDELDEAYDSVRKHGDRVRPLDSSRRAGSWEGSRRFTGKAGGFEKLDIYREAKGSKNEKSASNSFPQNESCSAS